MLNDLGHYLQSDHTGRTHAIALILASVATAGSLYFSLGMGLTPCRLCWYQRILMYPQVIILSVAILERRAAYRATLPMAALGSGIAAYHSYLQISGGGFCSFLCSTVQFQLFGVFTIPNMSFVAFTGIALTLSFEYVRTR